MAEGHEGVVGALAQQTQQALGVGVQQGHVAGQQLQRGVELPTHRAAQHDDTAEVQTGGKQVLVQGHLVVEPQAWRQCERLSERQRERE